MLIKEMSIEAFMNESLEVQIAQYNILAKRTNRQIRTFKKQGNEEVIKSYFPEIAAHGNIKMIKKTSTAMLEKMKPEKAREEITRAYNRLMHDVHGGITRENVMHIDREMEKVKEELETEELTPEQYYEFHEAEEYAGTSSALYYQAMKYGFERGTIKSFSKVDRPDLKNLKEHPEQLEAVLKEANDWVSEHYNAEIPRDQQMTTLSDLGRAARSWYLKNLKRDYIENPPKEMSPLRTNVYVKR